MKEITKKLVTEITENLIANNLTDFLWEDAPRLHEVVGHALEAYRDQAILQPIYSVIAMPLAEHGITRETHVGFATGRQHDIEAYYADNGDIELRPIEINEVPSGYAKHRDNLIAKRERLQAELDEIDSRLASGDLSK